MNVDMNEIFRNDKYNRGELSGKITNVSVIQELATTFIMVGPDVY